MDVFGLFESCSTISLLDVVKGVMTSVYAILLIPFPNTASIPSEASKGLDADSTQFKIFGNSLTFQTESIPSLTLKIILNELYISNEWCFDSPLLNDTISIKVSSIILSDCCTNCVPSSFVFRAFASPVSRSEEHTSELQ